MGYVSEADLVDALGQSAVDAIFDDNGDGIAEPRAIQSCLAYGDTETDAVLRALAPSGTALPLVVIPHDVKLRALDFALVYAMRRRPELVTAMGGKSWIEFLESTQKRLELYAKESLRWSSGVGAAQTASALPSDEASPPGALGASDIAFGRNDGGCCVNNEWIRKEGCS